MATVFDDLFTSRNALILLGGVVVGATAVTLLRNEQVRNAIANGLSDFMKLRDNVQAMASSIKEEAEDKYAEKIQAEKLD